MRGNPWYRIAVHLTVGRVVTGADLGAVARALVLLALEDGPRSVATLPRAWPVTRVALRAAAADAVAAGLCEVVGDRPARLRLTEPGRAWLTGLRGRRAAA